YRPEIIFLDQIHFRAALFDRHVRDIVELEIENLSARGRRGIAPGRGITTVQKQGDATQSDEQDQNKRKLLSFHWPARLRFIAARPNPARITAAGMPAMLIHLTRLSSASISVRSCLRICFNWILASASFFRKLTSSCCCSGDRINR